MTHTPGPWFVSMKPDWDEDGGMGPAVYDCDGGVFAVVDDEPETIARPFYEADAHLIAAAPEMLEVLEDLVDILEKAAQSEMDDDGMSHVSYNVVCLARSKAYDVLRKARGSK